MKILSILAVALFISAPSFANDQAAPVEQQAGMQQGEKQADPHAAAGHEAATAKKKEHKKAKAKK